MAVKKKVAKKKVAAKKTAARKKVAPKKPVHPLMLNGKAWDGEKVCAFVFEEIACSDRGLGQILMAGFLENGVIHSLPSYRQIMRWLDADEELSQRYARARELQADFMAQDILNIAENAGEPLVIDNVPIMQDGKPVLVVSHEAIGHAKLKIDSRKWLMSKLHPKRYGDKMDLTSDGKGLPMVVVKDLSGE